MKHSRRPTDFSFDDWSFYQSDNPEDKTAFEDNLLGKRDNEFDQDIDDKINQNPHSVLFENLLKKEN